MYKVGYCAVTADILHIGHVRFISSCASLCNKLVVGVMSDEYILKEKGHKPIMPYEERAEIVINIKGVTIVTKQDKFNLPTGYNIIFDSEEHRRKGATIYLQRTPNISSTTIKERIIASANNSKRPI